MTLINKKIIYYNYKNKHSANKAIEYLEIKKIIPLIPSFKLSSIVGHLIGDGNLSKDPYVGDFRFYGTKHKLEGIKKDVKIIFRIVPKNFYARKGGYVLKYNNAIIARVLSLVGVPRGNKTNQSFHLPYWIISGNKDLKKSFLCALCDDELSSFNKDKKGYFYPLRLKFNKNEKLINSGIKFLEEIKQLFEDLDVQCSNIKINNSRFINKYGEINRSLYFNISARRYNLNKFARNVGFNYEIAKYKDFKL